jgi:hypothetical protein
MKLLHSLNVVLLAAFWSCSATAEQSEVVQLDCVEKRFEVPKALSFAAQPGYRVLLKEDTKEAKLVRNDGKGLVRIKVLDWAGPSVSLQWKLLGPMAFVRVNHEGPSTGEPVQVEKIISFVVDRSTGKFSAIAEPVLDGHPLSDEAVKSFKPTGRNESFEDFYVLLKERLVGRCTEK